MPPRSFRSFAQSEPVDQVWSRRQRYHRCNHNWNVSTMEMMISLFLLCGLVIISTAEGATTTTTISSVDDKQAVPASGSHSSTQIPGNCSQVKCPPIETCPEDSYRLPFLVEPQRQSGTQGGCCPSTAASSQKCQCIPDLLCSPKECPKGWVAHVSRNATGKPGGCCPQYQCVPGDPKPNHHHYHHDPEKLHGDPSSELNADSSLGIGSSLEDDLDLDDDDELDEEEDSFEDLEASSLPASSSLTNERDDGHCYHEGKKYKSGSSWTVQSDCSECFCEHGLVSCKPVTCDVPAECRLARAQPLSCCPVCDGCVSNSGKVYNTSEVWQEDPCTNCTCVRGRIQCHVSMCKHQHSCDAPKHYPGECCPRCENEPPDSGHFAPMDTASCPFRDCHRDISCPNGFRLDKSGCPTCECQKCQSLLGCKLSCVHGFKVDRFGCTSCECGEDSGGDEPNNLIFSSSRSRSGKEEQLSSSSSSQDGVDVKSSSSSPSVKVDQRNLVGNPGNNNLIGRDGQQYEYGERNRYHHRQHQDPHDHEHDGGDADDDDHLYGYGYGSNEAGSRGGVRHSQSSLAAGGAALFCALDSDGVRRVEGEEWSDHCRRCVCRNGKEMCSLITCQAPKCEHPIFYPGDCCPRCPVEDMSVSFSPVNVTVCLSADGRERVEGEIWTLSSCLTCTCHSGQVLCAAPDCPPTPCSSPKLVDCCLQCPTVGLKDGPHEGSSLEQSSTHKNCLSDDSVKSYSNGETWKVGACQSCRCEDGQIQCFSAGKCPALQCSRPILAKNQCCPICLGRISHGGVQHGVEGNFDLHHIHGISHHDHHEPSNSIHATSTTQTSRGLEPHCAVLIACLLVVTILLSLYIVRQVCFHRRVSRRLIKKVPVGFHSSSSSSHSPSVTPDCCYKCDYSKYCDSGGCVIVGGGSARGGGGGSAGGGSSREGGVCSSSRSSSTNGSNGHLSSEQKPLFHEDQHSVSSTVIPSTPTPPPPVLTQTLLRDSGQV